ncbi:sensor histidine kinase [uncultured Thalassolituus sp.]|uniref:sensor histidine kinase n=1 Tax=uncultured Thalassolituus sp. TaxID=285273 RepID=UPI002624FF22|nr:ATP-binding protein [uncultured Thalassolituus sp.]
MSRINMASAEWGILGDMPSSQLGFVPVPPVSISPDKAGQKWLKRNPDHPLLVAVINSENYSAALDTIRFLRQRLQNQQMRLIIFASDEVKSEIAAQLNTLSIHRLQSLADWSDSFLRELLEAEGHEFARVKARLRRRESEMALLTWLARSGREAVLETRHLREISGLLCELVGARGLFISAGKTLAEVYPADLQNVAWTHVLESQFETLDLAEQPVRVQLDPDAPMHRQASDLLRISVTGSVLLPFRCYQDIRGYLLMLLTPDELAALDVATVNLLEKTADQLRAHAERQQSEASLKSQYERLQQTLEQLYSTQEQLFHAEKLSSLGQLAAGIAHEINNPVSYVLSNFEPLDEYISGMTELIRMHDEFARTLDLGDEAFRQQLQNSIRVRSEAIDLEFMMEDVFALVSDSRKGLLRVCDIVKNLKNFAHKDAMEDNAFDLAECFRDSLGILRHQLGNEIELCEELQCPAMVHGNAGMIGQVIINLVQNALHAMESRGQLRIKLQALNGGWELVIHDSGPGVPEDILSRIFDPFFTTKPVGKGTGLGLSTVHTIMSRHKGWVKVRNDQGARFSIWLPDASASPGLSDQDG